MSKNYLTEAFKELDLLESQSFDVDKKGTSELEDFLEDDSLDDFEVVIDPEAKTEEDLQKSYIGKAILMCDVCRSMIYKDPAEIVIDEESQLANVGELCPYCFTGDGYKVVGKVAPYEEITVEAKAPVEVKVDGKEIEVEDKVNECLGAKQLMTEKKVENQAAVDAFNLIKNNIKEFKSDKEAWKDFFYDNSTKDYKQPSKEDLKAVAQLISKMDVKGNSNNFTVTVVDSVVEPFIDVNMDIHPDYNSDLYDLYDRKEIGTNKVGDKYELRTYQFTLKDPIGDKIDEEIQQDQKFPVEHEKAPVMDIDLSEGYSRKGFSWEERNGEIKIFLDGEYHQTFPSKEAAMDAGWDLDTMNEEIQQNQKFPIDFKKTKLLNRKGLRERKNSLKESLENKHIIFDSSNPEYLIFVKNIPEDSFIWDPDYSDWIISEDLSNQSGRVMVSHNDEYIDVYPHPKSLKEMDKEYVKALKIAMEKFPEDDEWELEVKDGLNFYITKEQVKAAGGADKLNTIYSDFVNNSFVDGDSSSAYELVNLNSVDWSDYSDLFEEDLEESKNKRLKESIDDILTLDDFLHFYDFELLHKKDEGKIKSYIDRIFAREGCPENLYADECYKMISDKAKSNISKIVKEYRKSNLKESMDDISITTEDQVIKIKSTPREDKEAIQPVTETEIEMAKEEEPEYEEENIDLDEVEEEGIDEVSESYLKNVYENVQSFKTSKATLKGDNKMIVEGVITFKSGKKAKTHFIFESQEVTKRGKLKFLGENKQISKNKKAFTLIGSVKDKKLLIESFNYNYTGIDSKTGKTKRLYGTIRRSK